MDVNFYLLPHAGIQHLSPYVRGKSIEEVAAELGITDIIKLAGNENALGCSTNVAKALESIATESLYYYPIASQHPLHQQLSDFLSIEPSMLTLANGSDSLFGLLLTCFALQQDKHILTHDYAFSSYAIQAKTFGIPVVSTPTQQWQVDVESLISACTNQTALIFIANPNNPTGLLLTLTQIQKLLDHIPKTTILVLDEAYYEYLYPQPDSIALLKQYRNLVITRTFSKAYGLAGLRLGYAIADPQITALLQRIQLPFAVNMLAMTAASAALQDQDFIQLTQQTIASNRQKLSTQLTQHAIDYLHSTANFITINCKNPGLPIALRLQEQGIIVRPLNPYGMDNYLRVTIGTEKQNNRFLQALLEIMSRMVK